MKRVVVFSICLQNLQLMLHFGASYLQLCFRSLTAMILTPLRSRNIREQIYRKTKGGAFVIFRFERVYFVLPLTFLPNQQALFYEEGRCFFHLLAKFTTNVTFWGKLSAALLSKPYGYDSYPFTFKEHQRANLPQNQGRSLRYRTAERLIKNSWSLRVISRKRKRPRKLCSNELNVKKTEKKWSPRILKCRTYHLMNCEYLHG